MVASAKPCVDCRDRPSTITVRHRDLCDECFTRYVSSKVLKRIATTLMQEIKFGQQRRLLLPLSGGVSSLSLLQLLSAQIEKQLHQQGRTTYDIVCLHISSSDGSSMKATEDWWSTVEDVFHNVRALPIGHIWDVLSLDETLETDLNLFGLHRESAETDKQFVTKIFSLAGSPTAKSDLYDIFMRRFMIATARREKCDGILWGHSDSKLAALTLASVAKGRGNEVPNDLADGRFTHDVDFFHPMRDLSQIELSAYVQTWSDELKRCKLDDDDEKAPLTLRATSIDALMTTYITSQGEKYPSIMANVVRTAGKLLAEQEDSKRCQICTAALNLQREGQFCYGCQRLRRDFQLD